MGMVLSGAKSDLLEIQNKSVQRLSVTFRWFTTLTTALPDLTKILVKATLIRNGKRIQLFNSQLASLVKASMFYNGFQMTYAANSYVYALSSNTYLLPLVIDLKRVINLKGSDKIELTATQIDGYQGASGILANCNIDYEWREAIGNESVIPVIQVHQVAPSTSSKSYSLGDNVNEIMLISSILSNPTDTSKQINDVSITSDRYNCSDNLDRLLAKRASQFEDFSQHMGRYHSFALPFATELDNCQLNLDLVSGNITSGSLDVVVFQDLQDEETLQRSIKRHNKHLEYDRNKMFQKTNS